MAVAKVKIISNPYKKEIMYQYWDANEWININVDNNPESKLNSEKLIKGFFPFRVKEIVDVIKADYKDYTGKEKIEIVFEGTEDEYNDLEEFCKDEKYAEEIELVRSERQLENARDILPEINAMFKKTLGPLIADSVKNQEKIKKELDKYMEASNDVIPICVLGNYSSGKSSFINALIGNEILPSGARPLTAKIYRIQRSQDIDRAFISFMYDGEDITLRFSETE